MRQLTFTRKKPHSNVLSKLPMRQLTTNELRELKRQLF